MFRSLRGGLLPLPHAREESRQVAEAYRRRGIAADSYQDEADTEEVIGGALKGRRIIHLACHGIVDQSYGNLFGALALASSGRSTEQAASDGYLTLAEIYELDLRGCELAILSACDTNAGPEQNGEGVWAMSRGFLVAGARRVIASNWRLDDEATSLLVTTLADQLAEDQSAGRKVDYASALLRAKQQLRRSERWNSPYYWAGLVLIGPP